MNSIAKRKQLCTSFIRKITVKTIETSYQQENKEVLLKN